MQEIIMNINEFFDRAIYSNYDKKEVMYDGFEIITNQQVILLAIGNEQQCCEDVGYFLTNDDVQEFLGASLEKIDFIDGELKTNTVEIVQKNFVGEAKEYVIKYNEIYIDIKKEKQLQDENNYALFVNIHTNKGKLQFVAYNAGNGYYGHNFEIISKQLMHSTTV